MLLSNALAVICLATTTFARSIQKQPVRRQQLSSQETVCGRLIGLVDSPDGYQQFDAEFAHDCLTSVPFHAAVATRFLKYLNETLQFQSTLAYLKNPPEGYQQPAVDVWGELGEIQQRVNSGFYQNQYVFESDVHIVLQAMHDGHANMVAGAMAAFTFGSPYEIVSVSEDGKKPPKIYLAGDVIGFRNQSKPIAVKTINGEPAVDFLTKFAALNSHGYVEPHADWNALMSSPALDIQGGLTTFAGDSRLYPGENITFVFEDGDEIEETWTAFYTEPANATGPLTTGGDFFNYFVLGEPPTSFNLSNLVASGNSTGEVETLPPRAPGNWSSASFGAYPRNPTVAQYDLGRNFKGSVSGYIYKNDSLGVLSLPTFNSVSDATGNYSKAVVQFINRASEANVTRIVIDLQRNYGGQVLLAFTTFKTFFPDLEPFAGSRRRSSPLADAIGFSTTDYWDWLDEDEEEEREEKYDLAANEWVVTNRINAATGDNFTWWPEYAGPVRANGDNFSLTERYNLSNEVFDRAAFDEWIPVMYLPNKTRWALTERPFEPEQIVLLTDGLCGSTCSLFVEMMTQVGVRTVVAGGRPSTGPMQAASGNRGALSITSDQIDSDIAFAREIAEYEEDFVLLPEVRESGMFVQYVTVNFRDQVRENSTKPLQFSYEAADCRIYYTLHNVYNFTRLWKDAAQAAFVDPSLCVQGSTGFSKKNNSTSKSPPKVQGQFKPTLSEGNATLHEVKEDKNPHGGLQNPQVTKVRAKGFSLCKKDETCEGQFLPDKEWDCDGVLVCICRPICSSQKTCGEHNGSQGACNPDETLVKRFVGKTTTTTGDTKEQAQQGGTGFCEPSPKQVKLLCAAKKAPKPAITPTPTPKTKQPKKPAATKTPPPGKKGPK